MNLDIKVLDDPPARVGRAVRISRPTASDDRNAADSPVSDLPNALADE
jgi:hypothetical protein